MFIFLQNWRSTVIPAITISGLAHRHVRVREALRLLHQHAHCSSASCSPTGIVVDDAIVVIENVERQHARREEDGVSRGDRRDERSVLGVVVIGVVLVSVFVPVAFFPGTTGRMYQQFSLTIAFAVVLSVFNAVTFTPALSALLLDKEPHAQSRVLQVLINKVIDGGTNLYVRLVRGALRWRWRCSCVFASACRARGRSTSRALVVRAGRGRGLLHHDHPGAGGRVARVHVEHRQAGREASSSSSRRCWPCSRSPASASADRRRIRA
jgi:HAE1 family hydrophobic/amphiphilic exporter-1